jgi:hypothetical protein
VQKSATFYRERGHTCPPNALSLPPLFSNRFARRAEHPVSKKFNALMANKTRSAYRTLERSRFVRRRLVGRYLSGSRTNGNREKA